MPFAPPKPYFIHAIRAAGYMGFQWLCAEAVDNSFDAGGKTVSIILDRNYAKFEDDGCGLTKDRIIAPIQIGEHRGMPQTALGRFGVGITTQAIKHGNFLQVDTISVDGRGSIKADWKDMLNREEWYYEDPTWMAAVGARYGTVITIGDLLKAPSVKDIDKVRGLIAIWFYPAIANGRRIVLNGQPIPLLAEPELTDIVGKTLDFGDGRTAKIKAGLLKHPDAASARRVHVSYLHRVIKPECGFGCDGYSGLEEMLARIELFGPWKLTQFKDDLEEAGELEEEVENVLRPLLEKCHGRSRSANLQELINNLHLRLGGLAVRPVHKKKIPSPNPRKRKRGKAENAPPAPSGPIKAVKPSSKIMLEFPSGNAAAENFGLGTVDRAQKLHRIIMPRENPIIAGLLSIRDRKFQEDTILAFAMMLYQATDPQLKLGEFGKFVWERMAGVTFDREASVA